MKETQKATERRLAEESLCWGDIFTGSGIDVGPGDDILRWDGCDIVGFDVQDGDANHLHLSFPEGHFDFLHASQCLEHMHDPYKALLSWSRVVRVGGYLILTVPDFTLYEGLRWPSRWNPDHKSSWSQNLVGSPAPTHVQLSGDRCAWMEAVAAAGCETILCRLVDTNYDYSKLGTDFDQTLNFEDRVECFQEIVLRRVKCSSSC